MGLFIRQFMTIGERISLGIICYKVDPYRYVVMHLK